MTLSTVQKQKIFAVILVAGVILMIPFVVRKEIRLYELEKQTTVKMNENNQSLKKLIADIESLCKRLYLINNQKTNDQDNCSSNKETK